MGKKKRIGFMLASIHTGSSLNLWTALASEAERTGVSFYIFPGGRLDSQPDSEYLRNSVYRLANADNIDGLISWGSSIGGAVSLEELNKFHRSLEPLPYVTIAHKMESHPCVQFDAYTGMKALVLHFIHVHGARKIAFIRGPLSHVSAEDRFRAYLDALAECGLSPPIVSDPFPWSDGQAAAEQLYEERHLLPGRDFDTLIGASDMMVFSALQYFKSFGFNVPQDFHCGGFNDSAESRILPSALSTVRMPYAELGLTAFAMIRSLLSSSQILDSVLPSTMVIRESCGCVEDFKQAFLPRLSGTQKTASIVLLHELTELFRLDDTGQNAILLPLFSALENANAQLFINLFERVLERYFRAEAGTGLLFIAINLIKTSACFEPEFLAAIERPALRSIAQVQSRVAALLKYEAGKRDAILNSLKCDLLCVRSRSSLVQILALHLPGIGIHSAAIIVYEDEDYSRFLGGFSPAGQIPENSELFPARYLVPSVLTGIYERAVFVVQPLFMENQSLGYILCNVPFFHGSVFEELRSAISSALKGIYLFDDANAARQKAEEAEQAKTEFFANVGSKLSDPLSEITANIDKLEQEIDTQGSATGFLKSKLGELRKLVSAQTERTNRLIDLTLSQIHELNLAKRLFRLAEILPTDEEAGMPPCPLLLGDAERIAQSILSLRENSFAQLAINLRPEGLFLSFFQDELLSESIWNRHELMLAEQIILQHYGEFKKEAKGCSILIPWPNLAGLPPLKGPKKEAKILALSEDLPISLFQLPIHAVDRDEQLSILECPGVSAMLAWNPDKGGITDWLRVYALRHHPSLFRAPFLCYSESFTGTSILQVLESAVREKKIGPILFIGCSPETYPSWALKENSVSLDSIDDFENQFARLFSEMIPSLVIFEHIDENAIRRIRLHPKLPLIPVLVLVERIDKETDIEPLYAIPHLILCNRGIARSAEFAERIRSLLSGQETLPTHTGALVKKAVLYFNRHATTPIVRWKLADSVHVSEDYLTRIFHRELGLSLWEYLNRYRILLATELLLQTNETIQEIAQRTGFQDQAYFCRVFKKYHGVPPGKLRSKT
ncbi:hypothetical protein MASR2M78_20540 [Treponema sp.]